MPDPQIMLILLILNAGLIVLWAICEDWLIELFTRIWRTGGGYKWRSGVTVLSTLFVVQVYFAIVHHELFLVYVSSLITELVS